MKICIYGGAFDPVHLGHLYIADKVYEELGIDNVIFVPGGIPPWKKPCFRVEQRVEMVEIAIADNPRFSMDLFEAHNAGQVSYTYNTILHFCSRYPGAKLYFLIGSDSLLSLAKWHKIEELKKLVTFVAVERDNFVPSAGELEQLQSHYNLIYLKLPYLNVSSTYIREAIDANMTYRYMLKDNVYEYIRGLA